MKMKETFKRFRAMQKHTGGFTLVELIVVIAILAILAGVAIPAYSGYITKANEAADQQLVSAINRAFAAACIQNGFGVESVKDADYNIATHKITKVEVGASVLDSTALADFNADYQVYFAGNESSAFKVYSMVDFIADERAFKGLTDVVKVTYNGYEIYVSQEAAQKLANSTFGTVIGAEGMLGKVDTMSMMASGLLGSDGVTSIDKVIYGADPENPDFTYMNNLAGQLDMETEALVNMLGGMSEDARNNFLANSLVLSAAQKTEGMDTSFLGSAGFANQIKSDLDDPAKATDAMAQAALAYGMYNAYANSSYGNADMKNKITDLETGSGFSGLTSILVDLEDPNFQAYMQSDEGKADLDAYLSAMNIVNQSAGASSDAAMDILNNGFADDELAAALEQAMGK